MAKKRPRASEKRRKNRIKLAEVAKSERKDSIRSRKSSGSSCSSLAHSVKFKLTPPVSPDKTPRVIKIKANEVIRIKSKHDKFVSSSTTAAVQKVDEKLDLLHSNPENLNDENFLESDKKDEKVELLELSESQEFTRNLEAFEKKLEPVEKETIYQSQQDLQKTPEPQSEQENTRISSETPKTEHETPIITADSNL